MLINIYKAQEKPFPESKTLKKVCVCMRVCVTIKTLKNDWHIEYMMKMISNVFGKFICYLKAKSF